jgi:hypothetical protein
MFERDGAKGMSTAILQELVEDAQAADRYAEAGELFKARCAFFGRNLHSRMPLDPTHVRLKRTRV